MRKDIPETAEPSVSKATDPAILAYAQNIIDAPDEWTPHYTRSELLPMARAYVALHTKAKAAFLEVLDGKREAHVSYRPDHAYGGREHDADTPDPKCLLCRIEAAETTIDPPLVVERKAIYEWANGDALLLSARCAKAEASLFSLREALREIWPWFHPASSEEGDDA